MSLLCIRNADINQDGTIKQEVLAQIDSSDSSIKELRLFSIDARITLPANLPSSITTLSFVDSSIATLPTNLPSSITNIYLDSNITTLPDNLPGSITYINLDGSSIATLPTNLPSSVTALRLNHCEQITTLPDNLPDSLKRLSLDCRMLEALPATLPTSLTFLFVSSSIITTIPALPTSLTDLCLHLSSSITALPPLPDSITTLELKSGRLPSLPATLPASLINLTLSLSSVSVLPPLPASLKKLDLSWCCSNLENLPPLPDSLEKIYLSDCSKLIQTPELVARLQEMEARGCEVQYPYHFTLDNGTKLVKERLEAAIQKYKAESKQDAPSVREIFHRFLSEGVDARSGSLALFGNISPVLEFIEKRPNSLEFIDEIAKTYLDGCINQPVAGISEIAAYAAIAKAPDVQAKIEAAKQLAVIEAVKTYTSTTGVGDAVQVELGNALLREVHDKLVKNNDIKEPWLGVAGSIAYEQTIASKLTDANINAAYEVAKMQLSRPAAEIVGAAPYFAYAAFPDEVKAIEAKFARQKAAIGYAMEYAEAPDDFEGIRDDAEAAGCLEEFESVLGNLNPQERDSNGNIVPNSPTSTTQLQAAYDNLEANKTTAIMKMVEDKVAGVSAPTPMVIDAEVSQAKGSAVGKG